MAVLPPLSLYIHIPWCEKKCPYCDFNSHVPSNIIPESQYIKALCDDLDSQLHFVQNRNIESIFIGGGTPSLFTAQGITTLISYAEKKLGFAQNIEITMEANPGSSEQKKFSDLFAAGINRLSVGVQSFHPGHLQRLGRIHNRNEALTAITAAQNAGFRRINIDLMHGLPEQTVDDACHDLQQAIDTGVEHISWYQLTIEPNTEFFRYPPALPVDDTLADIQDSGFSMLESNGFHQYEISAFCRNSSMARHNINYWQFGDYLAIGAGAHGKITFSDKSTLSDKKTVLRFQNTRLPKDYLNRTSSFIAQQETITNHDLLFECLMNCLRLNQGMPVATALSRSFATDNALRQLCQPLIDDSLIQIDTHIKATPLGRRYLNTVLERLINSDTILKSN